jgi:hypothetical protein
MRAPAGEAIAPRTARRRRKEGIMCLGPNTRFVPVQIHFKNRDGYDSWCVQDVEQVHGCQYVTDGNGGQTLCFYSLAHAQERADWELARQVEYERLIGQIAWCA